ARALPELHAITNESSVSVVATIGAPSSVHVSCDQNLLPLIHTTVSNGTLLVSLDNSTSISPRSPCQVDVVTPDVTATLCDGSGELSVQGTSAIMLATVSEQGSGPTTISAPIAAPELLVSNDGSGSVEITSFVGAHLTAHVDGSGPI